MARPRSFDESLALDSAITCFWRNGLNAVSVRDLAEEMGLNCASLYNAFGDKRALFVQVLERYATRFMRERITRLEALASPKAAIHAFMAEMIDRSVADPDRCGCLIINTALEVAPHDTELAALVSGYLGELEAFFRGRIEAGHAAGEMPASLDPQDMARLLLALQTGLRTASRLTPDRAFLEGMVRPALALLDHPSHEHVKGRS